MYLLYVSFWLRLSYHNQGVPIVQWDRRPCPVGQTVVSFSWSGIGVSQKVRLSIPGQTTGTSLNFKISRKKKKKNYMFEFVLFPCEGLRLCPVLWGVFPY